jgi:hypothetical protein
MRIVAEGKGGGYTPGNAARVFDSSNPGDDDPDLGSPNKRCLGGGPGIDDPENDSASLTNCDEQKHILIIEQDGIGSPNDYAGGGFISFYFDPPLLSFDSIGLLDLHEPGSFLSITTTTSTDPLKIDINGLGSNTFQIIEVEVEHVTQVKFYFAGSGAIADLRFVYCPDGFPNHESPEGRSGLTEPISASEVCEEVTEKSFDFLDASCSMGMFNPDHIQIEKAEYDTVTFTMVQPFDVDRFAVWMDNVDDSSPDFCWYSSEFTVGESQEFKAKCYSGYARVSIYGGRSGDRSFQQIGVESMVPAQHCQEAFNEALLPEFNPLKRCYWELKIPCECDASRRRRLAEEEEESLRDKTFWNKLVRGFILA